MKKFLFIAATVLCFARSYSQEFNGSIDFKYYTPKDTFNNTYWVNDNLVKLDQYSKKSGNIEGSYIFDLAAHNIKFLSPKRKLWGEHKSETPPILRGKCEVSKGTGTKVIQGVKCQEYIVKNTEENTVITYWIATDKFTFFIPVVKMWNRKDKQSVYFTQITGLPEGSMPLMSEEKLISDGKTISKLEVVKFNKNIPDPASLKVPADYNKIDK